MKFLKRFISIEDLGERWALTEKQIKVFIDEERRKNPQLTMWYAEEVRQCPDGTTSAFVKPAQYLSGSIFDLDDILRLEVQYPALRGPKLEVRGRPVIGAHGETPLHPGLKTLSAYDIIRKLRITPFELVEILNGKYADDGHGEVKVQRLITTDESKFRDFTYNEPYFTEDSLGKVKIYQRDFDIYCEQWGVRAQVTPDGDDINNAIREKDAELLRLKHKCVEMQKTIQELEAQLVAPAPVTNKTALASAAKQENALAAWKPAIPAMLEVYHQCLAEGPTQRTKKDLERLFTRQGVELTQAQMAFFRDCLPVGHINKTGGATVQKS